MIRPQLASDPQFRARFRSEVGLASKVARFCTAPILDSDTEAEQPFVVTEFVDGPTLGEAVREHGPLSGSELHALGIGMSSALTAIHRAGVVHRDLKPGNVLLSRFGPRVIDFGIARATDALTGLTDTGNLIGTPAFMAPEQLRGDPITPATDVFTWGAVMAFAGTGRQPFGTTPEAIMYRVTLGEADLDELDPQLTDLVRHALSKKPAARPTAQQLLDTLQNSLGRTTVALDPVTASPAKTQAIQVTSTEHPVPATPAPAGPRPRGARLKYWAIGATALTAAAAVAFLPPPRRRSTSPPPPPPPRRCATTTPRAARPPPYPAPSVAAPSPGSTRAAGVTSIRSAATVRTRCRWAPRCSTAPSPATSTTAVASCGWSATSPPARVARRTAARPGLTRCGPA